MVARACGTVSTPVRVPAPGRMCGLRETSNNFRQWVLMCWTDLFEAF